jgi:thioredoxin-dependent peroxiredoxin
MTRFAWLAPLAALLMLSAGNLSAAELKVGDAAPDFELVGSDGKTYKLSDFKGKQAVVIAWFPKAFTGGCTQECKSFREHGKAIREFNVAYFTASVDTAEDNKRFAESLELDYPILSDPGKKVAEAYGVVNQERKVPFRHTYYIGKDGRILYIDRDVKAANHGKDLVDQLKKLGVETKG